MKDINFGKELVNKVKNILKNYDFEIIASEVKVSLPDLQNLTSTKM